MTEKPFSALKSLIRFILFGIIILFSSCSQEKIAYVDISKLFESFEYKKAMTVEYDKVKISRQRILDSLELELNGLVAIIETNKKPSREYEVAFEAKKSAILQLEEKYDEDNQILINSYNEKIIKQLNAYIKEFGKNSGYKVIIGADNKGTLLYADKELDITETVINYVNDRYKGAENKN